MSEVIGRISSEESMGLVDGPGIRYVVFMQGCYLRCKYCHNPETWEVRGESNLTTPNRLIKRIERYKSYFGKEGGVTFSGGEPLLQPQFLYDCLKICKRKKINTALDTSGVGIDGYDYSKILQLCDLVILDIKAVKADDYKALTGREITSFEKFLNLAQKLEVKLWLRQVIVPNYNDNDENIENLKNYIKNIKNVKKIELLPYKNSGEHKYQTLGLPYRLKGVPDMNETECKDLQNKLLEMLGREDEML